MKVVAETKGGDMLLAVRGDSFDAALREDCPRGRVLWRSRSWLGPPRPLYTLLDTRSWVETELPDAELRELLSNLKRIDGPGIDEPWE